MVLQSCLRATDPLGVCTEFEGFLEAEVWPVLCSLGCVLGWICSIQDIFPNLHKGLSALTAGLLRRPPEYLYKPLCFSAQTIWRYYLFLATIIFSGCIPWSIC